MPVEGPYSRAVVPASLADVPQRSRAREPSPPPDRPRDSAQQAAAQPRSRQAGSLADGRAGAAFQAQLLAQADDRRGPSGEAVAPHRLRAPLADVLSRDPEAEAQVRRGVAERRAETPQQSVAAYQRVAASSRAYAVSRYGAVRDVDGLYLPDPGGVDIEV